MFDFMGQHDHAIDEKGRTSLPASFREKLRAANDETLYITKSITGPCLEVIPGSIWREILSKIAQLPSTNANIAMFRRVYVSPAAEVQPDKAGRIMLPPTLRALAGLQRDIRIAGNIDRIEIWDRATSDALVAAAKPEVLAEAMSMLGL